VAIFLKNFRNNRYVNGAFYALRPASTGLIAAAGLSVAVSNFFFGDILTQGLSISGINWKGLILAVVLWIFTNKVKKAKKLHPIIYIAASAVIGIMFSMA
jgi:chromate transporter